MGARLDNGIFQHTILSTFGLGGRRVALLPVLLALAAAVYFGARATGTLPVHTDARLALGALAAWALLALKLAPALGEEYIARAYPPPAHTSHTGLPWQIVLLAGAAALLALAGAALAESRAGRRADVLDQTDDERTEAVTAHA